MIINEPAIRNLSFADLTAMQSFALQRVQDYKGLIVENDKSEEQSDFREQKSFYEEMEDYIRNEMYLRVDMCFEVGFNCRP